VLYTNNTCHFYSVCVCVLAHTYAGMHLYPLNR